MRLLKDGIWLVKHEILNALERAASWLLKRNADKVNQGHGDYD